MRSWCSACAYSSCWKGSSSSKKAPLTMLLPRKRSAPASMACRIPVAALSATHSCLCLFVRCHNAQSMILHEFQIRMATHRESDAISATTYTQHLPAANHQTRCLVELVCWTAAARYLINPVDYTASIYLQQVTTNRSLSRGAMSHGPLVVAEPYWARSRAQASLAIAENPSWGGPAPSIPLASCPSFASPASLPAAPYQHALPRFCRQPSGADEEAGQSDAVIPTIHFSDQTVTS